MWYRTREVDLSRPSLGKNIQFWEEGCQQAVHPVEGVQRVKGSKPERVSNIESIWVVWPASDDSGGDRSCSELWALAHGPLHGSFAYLQLRLEWASLKPAQLSWLFSFKPRALLSPLPFTTFFPYRDKQEETHCCALSSWCLNRSFCPSSVRLSELTEDGTASACVITSQHPSLSSQSPTLLQGGSSLEPMWRFSGKSGYLPRVLMTRDWARNPRGRKTDAISQKCPLTSTCAPWHVHAHTHACKTKESVYKAGKQLKSFLSAKWPHAYPSAHWVSNGPAKGCACHFVYLFACLCWARSHI